MGYQSGMNVDRGQGRKALEDDACWEDVQITSASGHSVVVVGKDGQQRQLYCVYADAIGRPEEGFPVQAALCLRWHVLATAPEDARGGVGAHWIGIEDNRLFGMLDSTVARMFSVSDEPLDD